MSLNINNDRVAVIIPTFNRADRVKQAVQSVLNQSHANIETIVVDDGSSDDTRTVLEEFIAAGLIRYIRQPHETVESGLQPENILQDLMMTIYLSLTG